jgi:hypothetical protein
MQDRVPVYRLRFNIRSLLAWIAASAVVLAVCAQIRRAALFALIKKTPQLLLHTALFALVPLLCIHLLCVAVLRVASYAGLPLKSQNRLRIYSPHRLLTQALAYEAPCLGVALLIACVSTIVTALMWPFLRELGLALSLMIDHQAATGKSTLAAIPGLLTNQSFVYRLAHWELFSIARWWFFYAVISLLWLAASWPVRGKLALEPASHCLNRLLAFGPWIVVLEIAFLVGVWFWNPMVVPEPSTGFVQGIFSWKLWHWDCWKGIVWLQRGMVPTFLVSAVFFCYVLRWRPCAAVAAAACAVPLALMLSVAWSVWYSHPIF